MLKVNRIEIQKKCDHSANIRSFSMNQNTENFLIQTLYSVTEGQQNVMNYDLHSFQNTHLSRYMLKANITDAESLELHCNK